MVAVTAISHDGKILAVGSVFKKHNIVRFIDLNTGQFIKNSEELDTGAMCMVFNPNASLLAVQESSGNVLIIEMHSGLICHRINLNAHLPVDPAVCFSDDGKLLACSDVNHEAVIIFDTHTWEKVYEFQHVKNLMKISAIALSHNKKYCAIGGRGNMVEVWDLNNEAVDAFIEYKHDVTCVKFTSDDRYIITVSFDPDLELCFERGDTHNGGTIKIWNVETKACKTIEISRDRIISVCTIQGDDILLGHTDGTLTHYKLSHILMKLDSNSNEVGRAKREREAGTLSLN